MIESILFANLMSVMTKDKAENLSNQVYKLTIPFHDVKYTVIYNRSKNKVLQLILDNGKEFVLDRPVLVTTEQIKSIKYIKSTPDSDGIIVTLNSKRDAMEVDDTKEVTFKQVDQQAIDDYFQDNLSYMVSEEDAIQYGYLFKIPLTSDQLNRCKNNSTTVKVTTITEYNNVVLNASQVIDNDLYTNNFNTAYDILTRIKFMSYTESKNKTNNLKSNMRRNLNHIEGAVISQVNNYEVLEKINSLVEKILKYPDLVDPELI